MSIHNLDFTGVESGAGYLPPGSYRARVAKIETKDGQKAQYLNWQFVSVEPDTEGQVAYLMTSLSDNSLWKLKGVLEALGAAIPQAKVKLDTNAFIGRVGIIHVVDEPYTTADGTTKSSYKVESVFSVKDDQPEVAVPEASDTSDIDFDNDEVPF